MKSQSGHLEVVGMYEMEIVSIGHKTKPDTWDDFENKS